MYNVIKPARTAHNAVLAGFFRGLILAQCSIVRQQFGRRNVQHLGNLEQGLQRHATDGARPLHLCNKVDAFAHPFRQKLLGQPRFFPVVRNL